MPEDKNLINTMNNFKASETPTISLFLSGRPLIVNEELNASMLLSAFGYQEQQLRASQMSCYQIKMTQ